MAQSKFQKLNLSHSHILYKIHRLVSIRHFRQTKLYINGDISDIYAELKQAFSEGAFVGSVSSAITFFVLSTMAKDYGMRVAYKTKFDNAYAWILAPKGVRI